MLKVALLSTFLTLAATPFVLAGGDEKTVFDRFLLDAPGRNSGHRYRNYETPPIVDLRKFQTSIKNQGGRDACPYFPPIAALEAAYRRKGIEVDLSTEHLIWLRNVTTGNEKDNCSIAENLLSTLGGGFGMDVLKNYAVARDEDLPYHLTEPDEAKRAFGVDKYNWPTPFNQFVLNRWNLDPSQIPPQARANARYGIEDYRTFAERDLKNPRKFEEVLANGFEIVFALNLHARGEDSAAGQPVWRLKPGAPADSINHFMLMVGYDRRRKFFIVKNQWGPTKYPIDKLANGWKDLVQYNGYTLVDYNYLNACSEAHYITKAAEVGSSRFTSQRALGQWRVSFKRQSKEIMSGVLAWRRLPEHQGGTTKPDLRIGDLVTTDGRQFRVNAYLTGAGIQPFNVRMYIDFAKGNLAGDSTGGTVLQGPLDLTTPGSHSMSLQCDNEAKELLWGAPASEVSCQMTLVEDRNLLLTMKQPK
jgi:hypothetical protein